uniref:C-type lectin domain family 17, member A isoform X4 n=1 Tax=Callithrix jacchus TaxID=9483 RepID=UPI0023DCF9A1|nr:C-type lectin domain family 17, member A isoform X4 [Callithrix jacchus]
MASPRGQGPWRRRRMRKMMTMRTWRLPTRTFLPSQGPWRRRRGMTMRTQHLPTRTFLPSQVQLLHQDLHGQKRKQRNPHFLTSPGRRQVIAEGWGHPAHLAEVLLGMTFSSLPGLDLATVTCTPPQLVDLEPSPLQPPLAAPVPWLSQTSGGPGCCQKRLIVCLCLLVVTSLILSCFGLIVTLTKYEELVKELRLLSFQQMMWRANVTGMAGLAGLKHDIDRVRADTNQSLVELWSLLDCSRVTCPEGWLPFESKCYYFSPSTKSWDGARMFCQENYSHLVIINSFAEHNFVAKAHGSPRVYWLGLNDREQEGDWRWLDGSPVTLSFWEPEEPNNIQEEDCASMNKGGTWNDLSCHKSTYWICERKCSC